jgi:surfeit locus 1 family protein
VIRTALRPRFVALLVVAMLVATAFAWLGDWQLGRSRNEATRQALEEARAQPVTPLTDVLGPAEPVTGDDVRRLVSASGRLETQATLRVPDRELDDENGAWLVAPLAVEGTGGTLPVVLGWLPDGAEQPSLPGGEVQVTGRLEQSEAPTGAVPEQVLDDRVVPTVSSADLVNVWEPPLYTAYLALTDPEPTGPLRPLPESAPPSGFALQNLSYAVQWWLFAAFAVFFWWRLVRDAHVQEAEERRREWTA